MTAILPYIDVRTIGRSAALIPGVRDALVSASPAEAALFGIRIPYLPDLLSDAATIGATEAERLTYALSRWTELIGNLWKWQGCGFSLRLLSDPTHGEIGIALLARISTAPGRAREGAQMLATDLVGLLSRLHLPAQPLEAYESLESYLHPFPQGPVVEVRQAERLETVQLHREYDIYVVYRCWAAAGNLLELCETLLRQRHPVLLNMHLESTRLTDVEQTGLARAAGLAADLADFQYDGQYYRNARFRNPHAEIVAQIYAANSRRLHEPFLVATQVASPDLTSAVTVARAYAASLTTPRGLTFDGEGHLPTVVDVVAPSVADIEAARSTSEHLLLADWGSTLASPEQRRLRFLTDARGAAAFFRLPLALRGGVPGVAARQVVPSYSLGARHPAPAVDELVLGRLTNGGVATIRRDELVRHALIAGFTRSGKTNTCLNLLDQLWNAHKIPFLVLEPVKTEYRGLLHQPGFEDLLIFTLGDESTAPFRLNPFELLPGIRLESHVGALRACFEAALPQFGVLPMLIEEGIHEVYMRMGWQMGDRGELPPPRPYPTMRDLHDTLARTVEQYAGEIKQNLQTALEKRVGSLLRGSKGRMFNTQRTVPLEILMHRPVILEMDQLGKLEQPLAMLFLLMYIREYRRLHKGRRLQHVTLIEEAHLIMGSAQSVANPEVAANTSAASAEEFERLLAEIGGSGEAVVIAEQSPSKLVQGAINNTGLKVAHQLVGRQEVDVIGDATIMDSDQKDQVKRLRVGQAAVFMSGYEKATFMDAPAYKAERQFDDQMPDSDVIDHMRSFYKAYPDAVLAYGGCTFCQSRCLYRGDIQARTTDRQLHRRFYDSWQQLRSIQQDSTPEAVQAWQAFVAPMREAALQAGHAGQADAAWCYWVQQAGDSFVFQPRHRERFEQAFDER